MLSCAAGGAPLHRPLLLLVAPRPSQRYNWDLREMLRLMGKRAVTTPLALPLLAALTPQEWEVQLVDEALGPVRPRRRPALVGIHTLVSQVDRAHELADGFRSQGVPVVLGGPQITVAPEPSRAHADALVLGEAEDLWEQVLVDALAGSLRPTYEASERPSFETSPPPRWDLVPARSLLQCTVQVSRGCPHGCEFCVIPSLLGRRQRYREVEDVVAELRGLPLKRVSFADDNLTADPRYARELLRAMAPLGLSWSAQASMEALLDPELVGLMAEAGCDSVLVGFESLDPAVLRDTHKRQNRRERYEEAVAAAHGHGIQVIASFVVGFDTDTVDSFEPLVRFTREQHLSQVMLNHLAPYPGSALRQRIEAEGRLLPSPRPGVIPAMRYAHLSRAQVMEGTLDALERIYAWESLEASGLGLFATGSFAEPPPTSVSAARALWVSAWLLLSSTLTRSRARRRLFFGLVGLIRRGVAHPARVVPWLLFVTSIRGYLRQARQELPEALSLLPAEETP